MLIKVKGPFPQLNFFKTALSSGLTKEYHYLNIVGINVIGPIAARPGELHSVMVI